MGEIKKVPEIRFGGFTDEWQTTEVGFFYNFKNGLNKGKEFFGYGKPIVNFTDVFHNRELLASELKGKVDVTPDEIKNYSVRKGDLFFTRTSETIEEIGYPSVILDQPKDAVFSGFVLRARAIDEDPLNNLFKKYVFNTKIFRTEMIKKSSMTTRALTSGTSIKKMLFTFPKNKEEQKKIGEQLTKIENLLKNHNTQLKKLTNLKKAMLIKMFPQDGASLPEIRFKGFDEEWNESSLDEEILFFSGLTYSPSDVNSKANTLVLRSSNVKNDEIIDADNVYVDESVINCSYVEQGDIIVVVRNGSRRLIGKHAQVKNDMPNTVIGAFMTGVRAEVPSFLNALLSTQLFQKQIEENLGATINQITTGVFKKMTFKFPKTNEQEQIGSYFQNLDTLISNHKEQLKKLNQIKKACLSKLFVSQD